MARFHEAWCFIVGVMGYIGCYVELLTDSVPAVGLIDSQPILFNILGYDISNISVHGARLAYLEGFLQALVGFGD